MLQNSSIIKIVMALLLLIIAGFIYGAARDTQTNTSGQIEPHQEQLDDESVVLLTGNDILDTSQLASLSGPVLDALYGEHYSRTGSIERHAHYDSALTTIGGGVYEFSITFLPSETRYNISLTVVDVDKQDFTVEVK